MIQDDQGTSNKLTQELVKSYLAEEAFFFFSLFLSKSLNCIKQLQFQGLL